MRSPDGKSERGDDEGKGVLSIVEIRKRRKTEVLCVQETKWRGDTARKMAEGYKMLRVEGDGRSKLVPS